MSDGLADRLAIQLDVAFDDLVDAYGPMVLTMATRLTDPSTGPDITQEVFLRAYRALDGYTSDRIRALAVRPWLATITRNLVRNEYRRRSRRATVPLSADDQTIAQPSDRSVEAFESHDQLAALLRELSDPQREAIVLRHLIGLPVREVALAMGCPVGTAKSHVSRGLEQLRSSLGAPTQSNGGAT